ncbi:MAG: hypothetical protein A2Y56_10505 [Candidatus Aminicenantes bacterium RBG_13_63_10]|nr:MAG: hypothetical protein A2Y56_10505 [Candidatus Aminicenantes bacterium RBG_13_63_10]
MMRRITTFSLFLFLAFASEALANKTEASLAGPESAAAGTEVTITVNISHRGNSAFHYTDWVWVKADGVEIARWDFKSSSRPESEKFSREVKFTVNKPVEITAEGHCSIHGSKGPATLKISLEDSGKGHP